MSKYQFKTEPMEHQVRALKGVIQNKGVYGLLMEPGVGKTKVAVDYLSMLAEKFGKATALVIAPKSAVDTWPDEVAAHMPDRIKRECIILDGEGETTSIGANKVYAMRDMDQPSEGARIVIVNFDVFSQSHTLPDTKTVTIRNAFADAVRKYEFDLIIVDESHRIKGHSSNVSRSIGTLARSTERRMILTGTVAPHSPLDLFAQWRFLNPDRFGTRFTDFKNKYAVMGGYMGKQVVGFQNLEELYEARDKDSIVVRKDDALDLPPVTDVVHKVELSPKEERAYLDMARDLVVDTRNGEQYIAPNQMVKWLRLRQITSGHLRNELGELITYGDSKIRMATDLLTDLVEAGEKVVIFAHFRPDVERMNEAATKTLRRQDVPVHQIHGDTPSDLRRGIRKQFLKHDGPSVVVAQMRTVSLAVNEFVAARNAIYLSMSERRDDYQQSRDRLNRKGQKSKVTFHHIVVPNSIDTALMDSHNNKRRLEDAILDSADTIRALKDRSS